MRSIGFLATSIVGGCSLMVSFEDLDFGGAGGAGGSGAGGSTTSTGGGGTCDGRAGAVGTLGADRIYVSMEGNEAQAAASHGRYIYRAGRSNLDSPFLVQSDATEPHVWLLQGDDVGTATAVAAGTIGAVFGGVKSSAPMTLTNPDTMTSCEVPEGELFVAGSFPDGSGCIATTLGGESVAGAITGMGILDTKSFAAGHGASVSLIGPTCANITFDGHFIASSEAMEPTVCTWSVAPALGNSGTEGVGVQAMATRLPNSVVVVGGYDKTTNVPINGCTLPPSDRVDAFALVLDSESGQCLEFMPISGSGDEYATGVSLSGSAAYIVGRYRGNPEIGGCTFPTSDAGTFALALTLDDNMSPQIAWARGFAATRGKVRPGGVAHFDGLQDEVRVAGSFTGSIDFGGGALDNGPDFERIFALALNPATGEHIVSAQVPTTEFLNGDDHDRVMSFFSYNGAMVMVGTFAGDTPLFGRPPVAAHRTFLLQASFPR